MELDMDSFQYTDYADALPVFNDGRYTGKLQYSGLFSR